VFSAGGAESNHSRIHTHARVHTVILLLLASLSIRLAWSRCCDRAATAGTIAAVAAKGMEEDGRTAAAAQPLALALLLNHRSGDGVHEDDNDDSDFAKTNRRDVCTVTTSTEFILANIKISGIAKVL